MNSNLSTGGNMRGAKQNDIVPAVVVVAMFIAGLISYPVLPDSIPVHWNIRGVADGFMKKNYFSALLFPLITAGMWILFIFLPRIDPQKEKYTQFAKEYRVIRNILILFMGYLYSIFIANAAGLSIPVEKALPAGLSIVFIVLGNLMGKIRQNYFVGFKFPWTLSNEEVWNRTHRLGGKLMVTAGLLTLIGMLISGFSAMVLLLGGLGVMLAVTIVYSIVIHKKLTGEKMKLS